METVRADGDGGVKLKTFRFRGWIEWPFAGCENEEEVFEVEAETEGRARELAMEVFDTWVHERCGTGLELVE